MKLQRAALIVLSFCLALGTVSADVDKSHRTRGQDNVRAERLKVLGQTGPVAATAAPVTTRGGSQTLYVAPPPTGNNATGDGSVGAPYATIQFAFTQAITGDTIRVLPGTYNECINNTAFALQSAGGQKDLDVVADDFLVNGDRTTTVIDGNGACAFPFSAVNLAGSNVTDGSRLEGFTVINAAASGVFILGSGVVTNNIISGNASLDGAGVYAYPGTCFYGTTDITVSNNQITNNTADAAVGAAGVDRVGPDEHAAAVAAGEVARPVGAATRVIGLPNVFIAETEVLQQIEIECIELRFVDRQFGAHATQQFHGGSDIV